MSIFKQKTDKPAAVDKRNRSLKRLSIVSTILFVVVVLVFNILFDSLLGKTLKWDWTTGQQYTIGDVSAGIIGNLATEIQIIGLFDQTGDSYYTEIQRLLEDYAGKSAGRVTVRYVDPDVTPGILTEVDPDGLLNPQTGDFVVYCPTTAKAKVLTYYDIYDVQNDEYSQQYIAGIIAEESLTGAIKYVAAETTPVLYFTISHEELDYAALYSALVTTMSNNNFKVASLDLFDLDAIPADCAVLIMASPQKDISAAESAVIATYLQQGGSLLVLSDYSNSEFPLLNELLADYNLNIGNSRLREDDLGHQFNNDPYTLRAVAPQSSLFATAIDGFILLDNARGINILNNASSVITTEVVLTSSTGGVAENKGDPNQSSATGTQTIAVLAENAGWINGADVTDSARVMVVGSTSIFSDSVLQGYTSIYNFDLFYYGIQWLSGSAAGNDLLIEAKTPVSYYLTKGDQTTYNFTAVAVMIILPLILLGAAFWIYRRRKNL